MTPGQSTSLQLPSFLHGSLRSVQQKAHAEGLRCGAQYREVGTFPAPRRMLEVPAGGMVVVRDVVDFQRESPAWRLYMVSHVMGSLASEGQKPLPVRHAYEAFFRGTAWGALFFATAHMGAVSAERTAQRLQAVLHFWEPLQRASYLFKNPGEAHPLEELMVSACDWAMDAWCPAGHDSVRVRLEVAAEHRKLVADPAFQRERLATLDSWSFERVSGARTGELISLLHDWDHELGSR